MQDISKFLTSLCSLSDLDSVQSGNHSLNPKERSIKLYYYYNQMDSPSFSLCVNPEPKFSKSVNIYIHCTVNLVFFPLILFCLHLYCNYLLSFLL